MMHFVGIQIYEETRRIVFVLLINEDSIVKLIYVLIVKIMDIVKSVRQINLNAFVRDLLMENIVSLTCVRIV